ncbi:uncharacterized protein LOC111369658 [Olea europaea var. sylvestris]|uniref:uncharacterized protein LOC111369658 n=1 Tax=Olea europaea var. sylvestris TaxID=158386 RepID=UPI000C1D0EF4|nr:uncharacterized protein LOC111369658 [Olea europaea var. sylvestris]XP_022847025.1 uncharacterized protein LOC111369658 [Olea europaea var. sylvestris]
MFNSSAGKNWNILQMKNYWNTCKWLTSTFSSYCNALELSTHRIHAPEYWWEEKIKAPENPKYAKYMNLDCSEIYDTYEKLFDDTGNSMKYALSPSKLSQRGFDLGTERRDEGDELPINAKTTDSSCCPVRESWDLCLLDDRANSSMNIFGKHGGEKRKRSHSKGKGHRKKYSVHEVFASLEQMVSVGNLASIAISHCM